MIAALTLFIVLTLSVLVTRTGAVALRLTGLPNDAARFQARSAFTGTGFTTSEAEAIVNHPVRRRIVGFLMVLGSLGFVSVLSTIVVSLVGSSEAEGGVLRQILWLGAVLVVLWFLVLNAYADRLMCSVIGRLLARTDGFGGRRPARLLQLPAAHAVEQILIRADSRLVGATLADLQVEGLLVLGLEREDGSYLHLPQADREIRPADEILVCGSDASLAALEATVAMGADR